jgi:hypothetical protein
VRRKTNGEIDMLPFARRRRERRVTNDDGAMDLLPRFAGLFRYPTGWNRSGRGFHPRLNRHTYQPHEHKREIARRQRQAGVVA